MEVRSQATIIIPTYNRAGLVGRAIQSALAQTHPYLDVLVVDDGSTDETTRILDRFADEPRVHAIRHDHNRGVTAAKNTGLDALGSETSYVGILDSDDVLWPEAVRTLVGVFESAPDRYSQVFGWCRESGSGEYSGTMVHREGLITYDDALAGRFAGEFWQLAQRDLLADRRFDPRAAGGESSVWWPLLRERPAWLVDKVVRTYDTGGADRISIPRYTESSANGKCWAYRSILTAVGRDMRIDHPKQYAEMLSELAKWSVLAGHRSLAGAASRQALRSAPSRRALFVWAICHLPLALLRSVAERRARSRYPSTGSPTDVAGLAGLGDADRN